MNESSLASLVEKASFDTIDEEMLAKFIPFIEDESRQIIFHKILDKELSTSLIPVLLPYISHSLVEAAVMEGQLEHEVLKLLPRF